MGGGQIIGELPAGLPETGYRHADASMLVADLGYQLADREMTFDIGQ